MRAWVQAFPHMPNPWGDDIEPYEHVTGFYADPLESDLRRKLTVPDRSLTGISCGGRRHGEPAPTCPYYTPEQLSLLGAVHKDRS